MIIVAVFGFEDCFKCIVVVVVLKTFLRIAVLRHIVAFVKTYSSACIAAIDDVLKILFWGFALTVVVSNIFAGALVLQFCCCCCCCCYVG